MDIPRNGITRKILRYLMRHPHAQDTVEGIAHWWLLEEQIREGVRQVRAALEQLTSAGLISEIRRADSTIVYRLNPAQRDQIQLLLDTEN